MRKPIARRKAEANTRGSLIRIPASALTPIEWEELECCSIAPAGINWHEGASEEDWAAAASGLRSKAAAVREGFYIAVTDEEAADDQQWIADLISAAQNIEASICKSIKHSRPKPAVYASDMRNASVNQAARFALDRSKEFEEWLTSPNAGHEDALTGCSPDCVSTIISDSLNEGRIRG